MLGSMVFAINVPRAYAEGNGAPSDHELDHQGYERLVEFVTGGLNAPVYASAEKGDS
jgi:hypothetical protein